MAIMVRRLMTTAVWLLMTQVACAQVDTVSPTVTPHHAPSPAIIAAKDSQFPEPANSDEANPDSDFAPDADLDEMPSNLRWWYFWNYGFGWWIYMAFLGWMLLSCVLRDPDRFIWIWVILIFQPLGAMIYFVVRWIPQLSIAPPSFLKRWTSGKEIRQLEIAAQRIGNAHQFIELGDALNEAGRTNQARAAFSQALAKEPDSLPGLWGGAVADYQAGDLEQARSRLAKVMELDRTYKFGDASLLFAKCLVDLNLTASAREQLEQHTRKWRHPEALFLLGELYRDSGEFRLAREQWEGIIADLESSPAAIARKSMHWKSKAKKQLKRLPST